MIVNDRGTMHVIDQSEPILPFDKDTPIPPGLIWKDFLSNRINKQQLVNLIVTNLRLSQNMLNDKQELFIASDSCVYKVTSDDCHNLLFLKNNHEEADTLMFALCFHLGIKECIIRSTDSDILCIACINQNLFTTNNMKVLIQSNQVGSELKYIDINRLFKDFAEDKDFTLSILRNRSIPVGVVYGIIHFLSGCDYLPHLRAFTKKACCDAVLKFGMHIFPDQGMDNNLRLWSDEQVNIIAMNFHLALYYFKYGQCFSNVDEIEFCQTIDQEETIVNNIRKKTWHKTLTQCCNIPTMESLHLAGLRFLYVFRFMSRATDLKFSKLNVFEYGWEKSSSGKPLPVWDTNQNVKKIETLLNTTMAKCGCKKSKCKTKQCSCVRRGFRKCSVLCTCFDCKIEESINNSNIGDISSQELNKTSIVTDTEYQKDYSESDDETSDNYSSDEDDEDIYNMEQDVYYNTDDTDNEYSDLEENVLM